MHCVMIRVTIRYTVVLLMVASMFGLSITRKVKGLLYNSMCITGLLSPIEGNILNKDKQLDLPTIEGCSVQKLLLIPKQQRLVVHATNSPYHIVDLRL